MAKQAEAKLISESVLGTDLSIAECEILSEIVKYRSLELDDVLFEPDTVDGNLYLLIEGKLEIIKVLGPNNSVSINVLKEGAMIGELSFIDGNAHTMRIKARKSSKVLVLSREDFEGLLDAHPKVVFNVMRSILRFSHQLQRRMLQENMDMQRMVKNEYMT
ncbi:Crp/Fnr family transcriptional regulator [Thiosulfativibrio zosterae]|uniref:Cyclic nucleotide-binding domain-containing protein n=1 Tax=Thiosulfativibrio zosterae TaxID=2675053 RepID=A0A6F8PN24_9GAMM|nr:cyclic nucleotide-binding domain-containing protein [Thiosulfativibrio zosterae]BBP43512.1 hypothetical protein THMIRHAT_12580 [Thiosulfativibrio zosterae]